MPKGTHISRTGNHFLVVAKHIRGLAERIGGAGYTTERLYVLSAVRTLELAGKSLSKAKSKGARFLSRRTGTAL